MFTYYMLVRGWMSFGVCFHPPYASHIVKYPNAIIAHMATTFTNRFLVFSFFGSSMLHHSQKLSINFFPIVRP